MTFNGVKRITELEVKLPVFLTLGLDERDWSASRSGSLTPVKRASDTHRIGN
jgi:hypothetical protein